MTYRHDFDVAVDLIRRHRELGPLSALVVEHDDLIVVVGSYKGATVKYLHDLYGCEIHGFEPQVWAVGDSLVLFRPEDNIQIHPYGLGLDTGNMPVENYGNDACSLVERGSETVAICDVRDVYSSLKLGNRVTSLMVVNIEGYEYTLLPFMQANGLLWGTKNLVVQLHGTEAQTDVLDSELRETHKLTWRASNWAWWVLR